MYRRNALELITVYQYWLTNLKKGGGIAKLGIFLVKILVSFINKQQPLSNICGFCTFKTDLIFHVRPLFAP